MPKRFFSRFALIFGSILLLLFAIPASAPSAAAAGFRLVDLLAGKTRPDKPGVAFDLFMTPVIYGNTVVFLTRYNGVVDALWRMDINTRAVKRLASTAHLVPGGQGRFACLCQRFASDDVTPTIGPGRVVFYGMDQGNSIGVYQVPIGGGTIRRIVDSDMRSTDGTKFVRFGRAAIGTRRIAFRGQTEDHEGLYAVDDTAPGVIKLIDDRTRLDARRPGGGIAPAYYTFYYNPVMGLTQLYYSASGLFDPVSGFNAVFRFGRTLIADHVTRLNGGTAGQHVRIDGLSADAKSTLLAFRADEPNTGFRGIFQPNGTSTASTKVFVSTRTTATGIGRYESFGGFGYDASGLAFMGVSRGIMVIGFVAKPAGPVTILARGDRGTYKPTLADRSISNGRIVFREDGFTNRLLLAVPK